MAPSSHGGSQGVVTAAGGWRLPLAWANLALLRIFGSKLPIEVWYLPGEMTPAAEELLMILGARARQIKRKTKGYWTMPHAFAETTFSTILHVAGDLTPLSNLDDMLDIPHDGLITTTDMGDMSEQPWFEEGWRRIGLSPPSCPQGGGRCRNVWEADGAVMVLDKQRCNATNHLRALAVDGEKTGRYGRDGDKETYRMAWDLAGCSTKYMPYPAPAGMRENLEDGRFGNKLWTVGMLHRKESGQPMGIHWAWGKEILQTMVPVIEHAQAAPLTGYGVSRAGFVTVPEEIMRGGDTNEFTYTVTLDTCHEADGTEVPCQWLEMDIREILAWFNELLVFARGAFHAYQEGDFYNQKIPLRQELPEELNHKARQLLASIRDSYDHFRQHSNLDYKKKSE
eukprot:TRINITY_DN78903_c0_g1_i1.p1 TRINITY_DN78903_c0_g1~~TRINITY_DN78903_c0_g1_i1.p1  ORF type:complete len:396 (+),score=64.04 TRINITY_DN78903_c0_g1_i1:69-1256(+)